MNKWRKRGIAIGLMICVLCSSVGCVNGKRESVSTAADTEESPVVENTEEGGIKLPEEQKLLRDKDTLYEGVDRCSVVTMYLTVSEGNPSENTDHTWKEVNSYSVYDYEDMGVERYAVNGLLQVGDENGPVEGELGYGQVTPNATVTIRGQSSSLGAQKNYRIEIKDGKGTWNNQSVINLNKHQSDGSRFINKLCYDLMTELPGMISLQTRFVHLYVKDETESGAGGFVDYGLYTQVEQPNKSFLKRHGLDKNGQLYKVNFFEFRRNEDVIMLKNDAAYDEAAFEELLEIKGDDDHSKLIAMLEDVNDLSMPMEDVIDKWFERDNLFSWMAFHILMGNIDTQSRNVLLYSPLNSNTWYFISWDCDGAFWDTRLLMEDSKESQAGWEHGVSNYWGNILFQRILKSDTLRAELDAKIQEYRGILTEEKLTSMVEGYAAVAKPYAYENPDYAYEPYTAEEYEQLCALMPSEPERNYEHYLKTLQEPMPFYIGVPEVTDGETRFVWENSYDFGEEMILYDFELATDYSFADPMIHETGSFIPEYVYEGVLEPGQYFIRVKAVNESGYEQYAFDYYMSEYKNYGIKCFYVMPDGSIEEDVYEEE